MQIWALIIDTFRETRDKKLFWVMLFISTLATLCLACIGFDENGWSFFFGAIKSPNPAYTKGSPAAIAMMAHIVSNLLIGVYIGWLGTVMCLVVTAGIFPSFIEKGTIDIVLSKPMSRWKIFIGKYIGSLIFVFVQAAYFVAISFFVLRMQTGAWIWGYLWCIPLLVALFSFVYCICVLIGMWTRSGLAALLLTLLCWMSIAGVGLVDGVMSGRFSLSGMPKKELTWSELSFSAKTVRVIDKILPNTTDIPIMAGKLMGAASDRETMELFSEQVQEAAMDKANRENLRREELRQEGLSAANTVGSSLLFEAGVLLIGGWIFCRRDF